MSETVQLVLFIFYNLLTLFTIVVLMAKSCPKLYNLSSLLSTTCGHGSLPFFSADHVYTRQQNEADRLRKGQAVRQVRQQLSQERRLKREAFHQVDELATEVRT